MYICICTLLSRYNIQCLCLLWAQIVRELNEFDPNKPMLKTEALSCRHTCCNRMQPSAETERSESLGCVWWDASITQLNRSGWMLCNFSCRRTPHGLLWKRTIRSAAEFVHLCVTNDEHCSDDKCEIYTFLNAVMSLDGAFCSVSPLGVTWWAKTRMILKIYSYKFCI